MYNIIFDTADVFACGSVIDAFVNVIMDVLAGEAMLEIIAFSLINFLVVVVSRPISTTFAVGVPTTGVRMGLSIVVVVVVLLLESIQRVIAAMPVGSQ